MNTNYQQLWICLVCFAVGLTAVRASAEEALPVAGKPAFFLQYRMVPLSESSKAGPGQSSALPESAVFKLRNLKDTGVQPQALFCWLRHHYTDYPGWLNKIYAYSKDIPRLGFSCNDWRGMTANDSQLHGIFGATLAVCGEKIAAKTGWVGGVAGNPRERGKALAQQCRLDNGRIFFVFTTGDLGKQKGATAELLSGIKEALPDVPVVGARLMPADALFVGTNVMGKDAAAGLMLAGDMKASVKVINGLKEIAGPFAITKAEGRNLFELDGKPAAEVYCAAVKALPWGAKNIQLNRDYPFAGKEAGRLRIYQQSPLSDKGSFEFELPLKPGEKLYIAGWDRKAGTDRLVGAVQAAMKDVGGNVLGAIVLENWGHWSSEEEEAEKIKAIRSDMKSPWIKVLTDGEFALAPDCQAYGEGPAAVVVVAGASN